MGDTDTILQNEADLLQTQIDNVNATITSQKRVIDLNDSYSKKMSAYTRLVLAIVFALAIAVLLNILKSKFAIIPSAVITIAYIILFSVSIVYAMFVVMDIESREKTDFDKLDLGPPSGVSKKIQKISQNESESGNMDLLPGFCIGKDCCNIGMAWDNDNNKCLTSCPIAGYYIDSTSQECTKCAAGNYAAINNATNSCSACAAGTYSGLGASSCTNCVAGKSSAAGASVCTDCVAGKTSVAGGLCTDCPAGKTSVPGGACTDCPEGYYSATAGASSCTACPAGYTNKSLGLTSLAACTA
jgi:hypothetical protein